MTQVNPEEKETTQGFIQHFVCEERHHVDI